MCVKLVTYQKLYRDARSAKYNISKYSIFPYLLKICSGSFSSSILIVLFPAGTLYLEDAWNCKGLLTGLCSLRNTRLASPASNATAPCFNSSALRTPEMVPQVVCRSGLGDLRKSSKVFVPTCRCG